MLQVNHPEPKKILDKTTVPMSDKQTEKFEFVEDDLILYRRWIPTFVGHYWEMVEIKLYLSKAFVRTSPMSITRSYINRAVAAILTRNGAEIPQ